MYSHVRGQIAGSGKYFSTLLATMIFSPVNFHVFSKIRVLRETFSVQH